MAVSPTLVLSRSLASFRHAITTQRHTSLTDLEERPIFALIPNICTNVHMHAGLCFFFPASLYCALNRHTCHHCAITRSLLEAGVGI